MCVFPVISLLLIKQNVLSLNTTAGIESDMVTDFENVLRAKDQKKRQSCLKSVLDICEQLNSAVMSYHTKLLRNYPQKTSYSVVMKSQTAVAKIFCNLPLY